MNSFIEDYLQSPTSAIASARERSKDLSWASDIDEEIHEGDIIVVSHNGVTIDFACYIDREEKEARAEYKEIEDAMFNKNTIIFKSLSAFFCLIVNSFFFIYFSILIHLLHILMLQQ